MSRELFSQIYEMSATNCYISISGMDKSTSLDDLKEFLQKGKICFFQFHQFFDSIDDTGLPTMTAILELDSIQSANRMIEKVNGKRIYRGGKNISVEAVHFVSDDMDLSEDCDPHDMPSKAGMNIGPVVNVAGACSI